MKSWTLLYLFSFILLVITCVGVEYNSSLNLRTDTTFSDLTHVPIRLTSSTVSVTYDTFNGTIRTPSMGVGQSYEYTIAYSNCDKILLIFESLTMNSAEMKIIENTGTFLFIWSRSQKTYDRAVVWFHSCINIHIHANIYVHRYTHIYLHMKYCNAYLFYIVFNDVVAPTIFLFDR